MADVCSILAASILMLFNTASVLHLAMQWKKEEIWLSLRISCIAKLVLAPITGIFLGLRFNKCVVGNTGCQVFKKGHYHLFLYKISGMDKNMCKITFLVPSKRPVTREE